MREVCSRNRQNIKADGNTEELIYVKTATRKHIIRQDMIDNTLHTQAKLHSSNKIRRQVMSISTKRPTDRDT